MHTRMPYVPVEGRPPHPSMGLRPLDLTAWLEVGPDRPAQMRRKHALLQERRAEVVAHLPVADAAAAEALEMLTAHLGRHHPDLHARAGERITDRSAGFVTDLAALHPVDAAGRLVQEDLCVLVRDGGHWVLGAASVCFPNRWRLAEKMGRSLAAVHGPVPGYPQRLERATDRLFDRITPEKPVWRLNWGLLDDPELFQPVPEPSRGHLVPPPPVPPPPPPLQVPPVPEWIGATTYFRVERQTVRALPVTGGALFTIRTYVAPLEEVLADNPGLAGRLAASVRGAQPPHVAYRGWTRLREPLLAYLDARE